MHRDFTDKKVVITGGSRGLGRALAFELGKRGAHIAIVGRDPRALDATRQELRDQKIDGQTIVGDLGVAADATAIAAQAQARLDGVDILIHNASSLGPLPMPHLGDLATEDFERVLQVNLLGPHRLTRALGGNMILRGGGTVLCISSDAAVSAYPGWGAYSAAKVALDHMSRIWAEECADSGLRFLVVDPGEMDTQMHADALPDADPATLTSPADVARRIASLLAVDTTPSGSRLQASDIELRS